LNPDGTVVAWANTFSSSTNVPAGLTNVVAIAGGVAHSLALKRDGTVAAWGSGLAATSVPTDLTNAVGISAGFSHSLALRADGTVRAWGSLGGPVGLSNAIAIASGYFHGLALKSDGTVAAWGSNTYGESNVPAGLTNVAAVAAEASHNLVLVSDGPPIQSVLTINPIYSNDGFSLAVPSQSGRVFSLEYKDSLAESDWSYLPLVAGTGKMITLTDPNATNSTQRFYRVRRW
jgi:alpha-tubulin suppressor-like RCC1 family protein